jgi:defect-in-organelle-trafficking protein DotB
VRDITLVPDVAQRMTRERGQTKVMHARTLHAAGRIGDDVVLRLEAAEGAVDDAPQEVQ